MRGIVIAPLGAKLEGLRRLLSDYSADAVDASRLGSDIATRIERLSSADFAVAVVPKPDRASAPRAERDQILIDIGMAAGVRLPVLVLVEPDQVLSLPKGITRIAASAWNEQALRLHLPLFLRSLTTEDRLISPSRDKTRPLGPTESLMWRQRLGDIAYLPHNLRGNEFEELVLGVLRAAGAIVEPGVEIGPVPRVDAVVAIPGEELQLGTILVEAKAALSSSKARSVLKRLQAAVLERRATLGLLIYNPESPDGRPIPGLPRVLTVTAESLIDQLADASLGQIVVDAQASAAAEM